MIKVVSVNAYPTSDTSLPTFDNTKLVALNTCPVWGLVRYVHHKTMGGYGRAMALEAGGAAHEVFAAHRLYCFYHGAKEFYEDIPDEIVQRAFNSAGRRVFGDERFGEMVGAIDEREDFRTRIVAFALQALYNCGFYDDPGDKRRTITNISEMCIAYMDRYDWQDQLPILFFDNKSNEYDIGIEIPMDITLEIEYRHDDNNRQDYGETNKVIVRLTGKTDGIHWSNRDRNEIRVHENKTASRLDEAWEYSWETNHQPTGYMIGMSVRFSDKSLYGSNIDGPVSINKSLILGTALPLPANYALTGISRVSATRTQEQKDEWLYWFTETVLTALAFADQPLEAPQYTHSCNRYFRPCSFIPLCASPKAERQIMFEEMPVEEWSPLEE